MNSDNKTKDFIDKARRKHGDKFDYSKVNYINNITPVTIICPIHGEFQQKPCNHLRTSGCPKCYKSPRIDKTQFLKECSEIHDNKYDYSKVEDVKSHEKICIICPTHGEFWQIAYDHHRGIGCQQCWFDKHTEEQTWTKEQFLLKAREKFGFKYEYDLTNYKTLKSIIIITCPKHGTFKQVAQDHLDTEGCPKCGREKASQSEALTHDEFLERVKTIRSEYDYTKTIYVRSHIPIVVTCPEHGDFEVKPSVILNGGYGCRQCTLKSQYSILSKLKDRFPTEDFIWEYSPDWLESQRIDIALIKYNIGIEYDGIQHFKAIDYFGGEEKLKNQQELDLRKEEKCVKNNFTLLRLRYDYTDDDFNNICKIIEDSANKYLIDKVE